MKSVFYGQPFIFGVPDAVLPIRNLPDGCRLRLRFRNTAMAQAFVKTLKGVSRHEIDDYGDHWMLGPALGLNVDTAAKNVGSTSSV